jgi:hypothetical protein
MPGLSWSTSAVINVPCPWGVAPSEGKQEGPPSPSSERPRRLAHRPGTPSAGNGEGLPRRSAPADTDAPLFVLEGVSSTMAWFSVPGTASLSFSAFAGCALGSLCAAIVHCLLCRITVGHPAAESAPPPECLSQGSADAGPSDGHRTCRQACGHR